MAFCCTAVGKGEGQGRGGGGGAELASLHITAVMLSDIWMVNKSLFA